MNKMSTRNALWLSICIIIISWISAIIISVFYQDRLENLILNSTIKLVIFNFAYGMFSIIFISVLLYLAQEKYKDIGFYRQDLIKQIGIGFAFGLLIFLVSSIIVSPLIHAFIPKSIHRGIEITSIFRNMNYLPLWIFAGMFLGGFLEELERIFILTRFEKCFGKIGLIGSLIASSIFFGIGHLYEGFANMISVGITGFLYALIYLRKRSALEPIIAHATFNTMGLLIGALMYR